MKTKTAEPTAEQLALRTSEKAMKRRLAARRWRVYILSACLGWGAFKVVQRAYEIQVSHPEDHQRDYKQEIELEAKRGNIYDRTGAALAFSVDLDSVFVDPLALRSNEIDPTDAARTLGKLLGVDTHALLERMGGKRRFVWVKRRITPAESAAIGQTGLLGKGVGMRKESRRAYPNITAAAHILGFTDDQGHGVEGLERAYETRLRGATDKVRAEFDARGGVVFVDEARDGASAQGQNLTLTIDREIQVIAERELEMGVRAAEARAGHVVVMNPTTGEILALANYPTFNPNTPGSGDPNARRNRAVQDRFEPGSVIKTFTIAGALASGAISPSQQIDCENGAYVVGDSTIHDTHRYGVMTPGEILAHSSNIGTAKIGAAMGKEGLYKALRKFGFGARTEIELPAETDGVLRNYKKWYEIDAATAAFGQGMSITNLQLATAMSAVANGGKLVKPMIVASISDVTGKVVEQFNPTVRRQVVPSSTAHLVTDMLTGVTTSGGTGEAAALDGYMVAGKTGTAQKADPRGGYADNAWTATFVGYAPAQHPELVVSVVIDEPVVEHYGGLVAGPVFKRIASQALRHMGVAPETSGDKLAELAKQASERRAAADAQVAAARSAEHREPGQQLTEGQVRVPDLRGQGARAALITLARAGLTVTVAGTGAVVEQRPAPGAIVNMGSSVHAVLQRPGTSAPSELAMRHSVRAESEALVSMAPTRATRVTR